MGDWWNARPFALDVPNDPVALGNEVSCPDLFVFANNQIRWPCHIVVVIRGLSLVWGFVGVGNVRPLSGVRLSDYVL